MLTCFHRLSFVCSSCPFTEWNSRQKRKGLELNMNENTQYFSVLMGIKGVLSKDVRSEAGVVGD